eukprot:scaffold82379_cov67-Phaeocystis_antarctica.AAC.2
MGLNHLRFRCRATVRRSAHRQEDGGHEQQHDSEDHTEYDGGHLPGVRLGGRRGRHGGRRCGLER